MSEPNTCKFYDPSCALKWLSDEFKAFWLYIYDSFLSGLAVVVEAITVPDFLLNVQTVIIPSSVSWFLQPFNITFGLTAIVVAYTARFVLRRIPFIG